VGDIGGTNARFALVEQGSVELSEIEVFRCEDYTNFDVAFAAYFEKIGKAAVTRACLSFACPIAADISMTNNHWCFNVEEMKKQLKLQQMLLLNDFTAMAYGTLFVDQKDKVLVQHGDDTHANDSRLVIGPGTGLGVSGLVPIKPSSDKLTWQALTTEGGHVSFAPANELQQKILDVLQQQFSRVSVERLLSGDGLYAIYVAICQIQKESIVHMTAAQVSQAAIALQAGSGDGDDQFDPALKSLSVFCEVLGAVTGDMVLAQGSRGGVYLCGGILPRIKEFLLASNFRQAMCDKGRLSNYLEQVPVWLCDAQYPGLLGAAAALKIQS
jgi:glucokinase